MIENAGLKGSLRSRTMRMLLGWCPTRTDLSLKPDMDLLMDSNEAVSQKISMISPGGFSITWSWAEFVYWNRSINGKVHL